MSYPTYICHIPLTISVPTYTYVVSHSYTYIYISYPAAEPTECRNVPSEHSGPTALGWVGGMIAAGSAELPLHCAGSVR